MFSTSWNTTFMFWVKLNLLSAIAFSLEKSKNVLSCIELGLHTYLQLITKSIGVERKNVPHKYPYWLIGWMVYYAAFNSISVISRRQFTLFMFFLGLTSTRLGSEVSCPRTLPQKNPEDPVRLEPRTPGLQVKHFTTEPHGTLQISVHVILFGKLFNSLPDDKILDISNINSSCN